ncbi:hypothetical protein Leryth_007963 [Lithospermum erythrorhizon]|nr:hypothetical protein Leryth_007963 [Lithospermum erythrorhizon]
MFQSQTHNVKAQPQNSCSTSLGNLNVCAPFVVPGALNTNPSHDCCNALQAIDHDCLCNSLRVTARLPSQCNLPSISCAGMSLLMISICEFHSKINFAIRVTTHDFINYSSLYILIFQYGNGTL